MLVSGSATEPDPDYSVSIWSSDTQGNPGASLATLDKPSSLSPGYNTFTAPGDGIDLEADTTYFVVVDVGTVSSRRVVSQLYTNETGEDAVTGHRAG